MNSKFTLFEGRRLYVLCFALLLAVGIGTYSKLNAEPQATPAVKVTLKNFGFDPKEITVPVGGEVEWVDEGGRHTINADDGSFKSDVLTAGGSFKHTFDKAGRFGYYCMFHGSKGGHDMAGVVVVK